MLGLNWKSNVLGTLLSLYTGYLVTLFIIFIVTRKVNLFLDINSCNVLAFQIEKQAGGMAEVKSTCSFRGSEFHSQYLSTTICNSSLRGSMSSGICGHQAHIWRLDIHGGKHSYT